MTTKKMKMTRIEVHEDDECIFRASYVREATEIEGWVLESEQFDEKGEPAKSIPIHSEFDYVMRKMKQALFDKG